MIKDKRIRLLVFRSNKYIYAQLIDDENNKTITGISDRQKNAFSVGEKIAEKALDLKIAKVVFDRNGYKYHGLVKSLAEGARKKGLVF